jgi:glucose/arabinose dehydrogenase
MHRTASTRTLAPPPARALALALALFAPLPAHAAPVLPAGFVAEDAVPEVTFLDPTAMAFLGPDRFLVAEQGGRVWVVDHGTLLPTPAIDLSDHVLYAGDRGLLGLAVDPQFAINHHIYLLYTVEPDSSGQDTASAAYGRLVRYTMSAADSNLIDPATRVVLMGRTWSEAPPSGSITHAIGCLRWGRDGSLLVSAGDGAEYSGVDDGGRNPWLFAPGHCDPSEDIGAFRAQDLNSLGGKILRVDPATGLGYPSNPFYDGDPASKRSRIWAYGVRNTFRFSVKPGTGSPDPALGQPGTLYLGDVGWETWEEVDVAKVGGLNFGWPCHEGFHDNAPYQGAAPDHSDCTTIGTPINPSLATPPLLDYHHTNPSLGSPPGYAGIAVLGGAIYSGIWYPPTYRGAFFFGDYAGNWIRYAQVDSLDHLVGVFPFGTLVEGAVDFAVHPQTRDLYYVGIYTGQIFHIRYQPNAGVTPERPGPALSNAWPQPARGEVRLALDLPEARQVSLRVLDPQGREVRDAGTRVAPAGRSTLTWDARTTGGARAAPGIYFVRVTAGDARLQRRVILLD